MKTIIAAFSDRAAAEQAIAFLHNRGVDDIELMTRDTGQPSLEHLRDFDVPDDRARLYLDAVEHGAPVIAAHTERDAEELAMELDRLGSLDLELGTAPTEPETWSESEAATGTTIGAGGEAEVIEERVAIGTREVPRGGVRVRTFVTEHPVRENVQLTEERIAVEREPVDERLSPAAAEAELREEEFEVTARGEEVVVGKEARVVERVHVGKTAETRTESVEGTERRQDVAVEAVEATDREPKPRP